MCCTESQVFEVPRNSQKTPKTFKSAPEAFSGWSRRQAKVGSETGSAKELLCARTYLGYSRFRILDLGNGTYVYIYICISVTDAHTHTRTHAHTHTRTHTHAPHAWTQSLACATTHSFTHSHPHSLVHSLTHSLIP